MAHSDWAMLYNIKLPMLHKWNPTCGRPCYLKSHKSPCYNNAKIVGVGVDNI